MLKVETVDNCLTVSPLQGEQGGPRGVRGLAGQGAGRPGEGARHQRGRARQAGGRQAGAGAAAGGAPLPHQHCLGLQRWVDTWIPGPVLQRDMTAMVLWIDTKLMGLSQLHNIQRLGGTIKYS